MPFSIARRRLSALPIVVAVAVAAAGCASSEDVKFVDGYNDAVAPLSTTLSRMNTSLTGDPASASKSLNRVADKLVDVREELAALHPPADAADKFDQLLTELDKAPKQVRAMARATRTGDIKGLGKATADLSATGTELVSIEQELRTIVED